MDKDLDTLRKVALSATPGPWKAEPYLYGMTGEGHRIRVTAPSNDDLHNLADDILQEDAEFIATFDPPTVLELIEQVEYCKRENETIAALSRASRDWNIKNRADLTARLEKAELLAQVNNQVMLEQTQRAYKAEQAVARVRELNQFLPASIMERVTRSLDGGQG